MCWNDHPSSITTASPAGADQARDQFLHQQRLARPRLARYTDPHTDAPPPADMELPGTVKFHDPTKSFGFPGRAL